MMGNILRGKAIATNNVLQIEWKLRYTTELFAVTVRQDIITTFVVLKMNFLVINLKEKHQMTELLRSLTKIYEAQQPYRYQSNTEYNI